MHRLTPLSTDEVLEYVQAIPGLVPSEVRLSVREIGDGNMNYVFRVTGQGNSKITRIIVKQALPYMRSVGAAWPLTADRIRVEYETLKTHHQLCPGSVPRVLHYDDELSLIVMEDLSSHIVLRDGLISGKRFPSFASQIGVFLARTLFFTSSYALNATELEFNRIKFANPDMVKITSDFIFTFPFMNHEMNRYNPVLDLTVQRVWNNGRLHDEIAGLKRAFNHDAQALIHGDLHTGSIMVTGQDTKVIDPEFAFYGPMGFDIGLLFANLLLAFCAYSTRRDAADSKVYQAYLLRTIELTWLQFEAEFQRLWNEFASQNLGLCEDVLIRVLQDSLGFAGCEMIRRVIGTSHVTDLERVEDPGQRTNGEAIALHLGQHLILWRSTFRNILDFIETVRDCKKRDDS
ncbi:S-methyl-5-thioribose kinase [Alicyclobacillus ferrooxydans]|uniref:S-methyl-5-thioribose kinase n=1 Tax=Alicyclobacillus ferrooxydans TaxID=471514 RepID=A0A0P9D6P9_9BACL|nr:S-methyl-5-thioribose kinase [Alicyclobacillus ferrooxydans]KPV45049.1 hypothetical protein AN477_04065 [Alicyclobacillus ferrooxydans]